MIVFVAERSGNSSQKQDAKSIKSRIACMILLAVCLLICDVQCQFFTKSSKSIPRMGRRSLPDNSQQGKIGLYRRMLIDRLVDEFGPIVVAKLQEEAKMASPSETGAEVTKSPIGGELYERNDQPFDLNNMLTNDGQPDTGSQLVMSRNERGGSDGSSSQLSTQPSFKLNSKSLAMRAFNTDRLLQHLASGGSPVMSYDRLLDS